MASAGANASAGSGLGGGGAAGAATNGGAATGGALSAAGAAGSAGAASGGGGSGGAGSGSGGGGAGTSGCVPDPNGTLSVKDEVVVHDAKSCLDWMKVTKEGVNYAAAEMYCADATTGGFDDWRIPSASEFASIVTLCGKYAPEGPVDKVFELKGDGYWTTTPAGEPNKVCAVGMLNAGGYYHYGTAGPQVVRCVRGTGTFKMVKDCTQAMGCSNW